MIVTFKNLLLNLLALAVYFAAAVFGLKFGAVSGFASLVWPSSGIALAALFIFGFRLLPGIALGALLANWQAGAPVAAALGISLGNSLEGVAGVYLLRRFGFRRAMDRVRDVFFFLVLAGVLSTLIAATVGTISLYLAQSLSDPFADTWAAWWLGDFAGVLLVAPFLLVWSAELPQIKSVRQISEILLVGSFVLISVYFIFSGDYTAARPHPFLRAYFIFPILMLVAARLGQKGVSTFTLVVSAFVISSTVQGLGRFWTGELSQSLANAQMFLMILAVSELVLAAAFAETRTQAQEAKEAVLARDEFLSIASHELKTPLTSLSLQLQMLKRNFQKGLAAESAVPATLSVPAKVLQSLDVCEIQSKKLTALLDELLDLTRIRLGHLQLNREEADLSVIVNDVAERFRIEAAQKGIEISVSGLAAAVGLWDRVRLEQVVSNLISNALKYGEGKPVRVWVQVAEAGRAAKVVVRDQGMGISEDMQTKIFERFERAGISGEKIAGLGLGLYITRQIVEAHGGKISVQSALARGSVFTVELPLKAT